MNHLTHGQGIKYVGQHVLDYAASETLKYTGLIPHESCVSLGRDHVDLTVCAPTGLHLPVTLPFRKVWNLPSVQLRLTSPVSHS